MLQYLQFTWNGHWGVGELELHPPSSLHANPYLYLIPGFIKEVLIPFDPENCWLSNEIQRGVLIWILGIMRIYKRCPPLSLCVYVYNIYIYINTGVCVCVSTYMYKNTCTVHNRGSNKHIHNHCFRGRIEWTSGAQFRESCKREDHWFPILERANFSGVVESPFSKTHWSSLQSLHWRTMIRLNMIEIHNFHIFLNGNQKAKPPITIARVRSPLF